MFEILAFLKLHLNTFEQIKHTFSGVKYKTSLTGIVILTKKQKMTVLAII
jgi:hypothetical protein